ncbi:zinc-ribbon domain-containing protein [Acetobacterium wieringae]|uniref:zinc-ribbon domain-containing protein n=1 Tax=Acetobacterium wieringae TaxID=52694 RepID=UPI002033E82F|nr:zinc ribbon domain-containing protein [Acetobacterium wieringae]URN83219.1 zinc ribbon domain-containing protein [Acetobacterium wieringae]
MFCENCGKQIPDDAAFCTHCGAKQLGKSASSQSVSSTQSAATDQSQCTDTISTEK